MIKYVTATFSSSNALENWLNSHVDNKSSRSEYGMDIDKVVALGSTHWLVILKIFDYRNNKKAD
jgi:hypothetical protein